MTAPLVTGFIISRNLTIPALAMGGGPYTLLYTTADFQIATGFSELVGPLALTLDVDNTNMIAPIFVGIQIETDEGIISISDRQHIGFVPAAAHTTIGPASVPQLGYISGTVKKITLSIYPHNHPTQQVITLNLRITPATVVVGPQPYIGKDRAAQVYALPATVQSAIPASIAANSTATLLAAVPAAPAGIINHIRFITMAVGPTPFPGDLYIYDSSSSFALHSMTNQWNEQAFYIDDYNLGVLSVFCDNHNTTNAYSAIASIHYEQGYYG